MIVVPEFVGTGVPPPLVYLVSIIQVPLSDQVPAVPDVGVEVATL